MGMKALPSLAEIRAAQDKLPPKWSRITIKAADTSLQWLCIANQHVLYTRTPWLVCDLDARRFFVTMWVTEINRMNDANPEGIPVFDSVEAALAYWEMTYGE